MSSLSGTNEDPSEAFARRARHDLNEPLRAISTYLSLFQREYEGRIDPRADEYIRITVDAAKRMSVMIDDLFLHRPSTPIRPPS
jgi:light-regulated signal transduction histidine kinase (bacteriophytochrome)